MREDPPWTSARLVVADVEGNGHRPPSLVEAAVVPIVAGRIGEPASWLVRPPEAITWQATTPRSPSCPASTPSPPTSVHTSAMP